MGSSKAHIPILDIQYMVMYWTNIDTATPFNKLGLKYGDMLHVQAKATRTKRYMKGTCPYETTFSAVGRREALFAISTAY